MTKHTDGGPAFPVHGGHHPDDDPRNHTLGGGMTLRDWFAGQALAGILANPNIHKEADALGVPCIDIAVPVAYIAADKMLEARK